MSTLYVLLPPLAHAGEAPGFSAWLAHGNRLQDLPDTRDATLRAVFHFVGGAIPVAALRHHAGADAAGNGAWLAADPAYVRGEATGARLVTWPIVDLTGGEAEQLAAGLRPLFGDAGTPLSLDAPSAWCLHLPGGAPKTEFVRPVDALGVDMLECLPRGESARVWRRLFNEAQVALHAHPVNAARTAAGKLPVDALWFWGAGTLPGSVDTTLRVVASGDGVVRGLAKVARIACVEPLPSALQTIGDFGHGGDALLDLDAPGRPGIAGQWLGFFRQWLSERRFDAITLAFAGGERYRLRHSHRLRFWRRA